MRRMYRKTSGLAYSEAVGAAEGALGEGEPGGAAAEEAEKREVGDVRSQSEARALSGSG